MDQDQSEPQASIDYQQGRVPRLQGRIARIKAVSLFVFASAPLLYAFEAVSIAEGLALVAVAYFGRAAATEVCNLYIDTLIFRARDLNWREDREFEIDRREGWIRRKGDQMQQPSPCTR